MSPQNRLLTEMRFTLHGHTVVAYLPLGRRHGDRMAAPEPVMWRISVDGGPAFNGPVYGGQTLAETAEAQAELELFLQTHPQLTEPD